MGMKSLLITGLLILGKLSLAQPPVKLFVYSQVFTPGMVPQRDIPSENGAARVNRPAATTQYYIYAAVGSAVSIYPDQVWIKGQWYKISKTNLVKAPVMSDVPATKVLVPAGHKKVLGADLGAALPAIRKPFPGLVKMMSDAEFILRFAWKGKFYYSPLKKITVLDPVHAQ
jgi:hypothetical protein